MSAADRLMADVERLAEASVWWFWSSLPRPLTPGSPAEDERAQAAWDTDHAEHEEARRLLGLVRDRGAAYAALTSSVVARRHAAHAIRRLTRDDWAPLVVVVFSARAGAGIPLPESAVDRRRRGLRSGHVGCSA